MKAGMERLDMTLSPHFPGSASDSEVAEWAKAAIKFVRYRYDDGDDMSDLGSEWARELTGTADEVEEEHKRKSKKVCIG